tara:strand:- start:321 stop:665 length:345 start_codon:yes stop_codon:yes gene_type:complete
MNITIIHSSFRKNAEMVAMVEAPTTDVMKALNYAYAKTQNVFGSWSRGDILEFDGEVVENEDYCESISVLKELKADEDGNIYGIRSTSVGDRMILDNGTEYEVDDIGFKLLETV